MIILLGIYLKESNKYIDSKTHRWMFTATLFIIAKTWKQQKYFSVGEQINKLWYIPTMEYYSALKGNELSSHEQTGRKLKCILLREVNLKSYILYVSNKRHSEKDKTVETIKRSVFSKA